LEELKQICDRVTVMRDGQYIATTPINEITTEQIIAQMVGREIYETVHTHGDTTKTDVVLEVKNLKQGKRLRDVSFSLHRGEILGFAGLLGAGRTETARAIFGADPLDSGEIYVKGKRVEIKHPRDAVAHGIGYLSEDRKQFGLALGLSVETNVVLASLKKFLASLGIVNKKQTRNVTQEYVERLKIKTPSIDQITKNLSGGNQQKVVISKWLVQDCDILIFDEPTRGIDVGAKSEIYKLLNELADQGKSIIMISSELPEILRMSHRIVVMCEGKVTAILPARDCTQEKIMQYATLRN
ncbi:MAG TPA: sugar ABC transporter ATP-binding protein, partial [Spirochaetales bacterium]|nr:sugar ABC transporter ATP-binding protein [Spirochaetales bacterium]